MRCFSESLLGVGDLSPPPPPAPTRGVDEDAPPAALPSTVLGDGDLESENAVRDKVCGRK